MKKRFITYTLIHIPITLITYFLLTTVGLTWNVPYILAGQFIVDLFLFDITGGRNIVKHPNKNKRVAR